MGEINKPTKRTFWKVTTTGLKHDGFTETDQVTTAPYALTLFDTTVYGINGASQVPEQLTVHFT